MRKPRKSMSTGVSIPQLPIQPPPVKGRLVQFDRVVDYVTTMTMVRGCHLATREDLRQFAKAYPEEVRKYGTVIGGLSDTYVSRRMSSGKIVEFRMYLVLTVGKNNRPRISTRENIGRVPAGTTFLYVEGPSAGEWALVRRTSDEEGDAPCGSGCSCAPPCCSSRS